jgi:hypothetical protein
MATLVSRLTSTGTLYTIADLDEITTSTYRLTTTTLFVNELDEVTSIGPASQKLSSTGTLQIANIFDETGTIGT